MQASNALYKGAGRQQRINAGGLRAAKAPAARHALRVTPRRAPTVVIRATKHEYQVVREERPDGKVALTVTIPPGLVQRRFTEIVDIMRRDVVGPLKGYRLDKIPLGEVVSRVGGQAQFKAACVEHVLIKAQEDVMPVHATRMLPGSERITSDVRGLVNEFDPAKGVTYTLEFDALPAVRWARPYRGIEVTVEETGSLATDEAAVADLIKQYRKDKGRQRVVADRGLEKGDVAIIDMKVMPAGSDRPYPGLDKTKLAVDTDEDPLGLAKGMHGMAPGDARKWDFNFPDDWHVELWRGQRATADVKLRELFEWDLPEFDDAFVAANYPSFESADDMRKSLLASTALERFKAAQAAAADRIMEAVAACVDIEVPEAYVDAVAAREYQEKLLGMVQAGVATPEQAERMATEEGLRAFIDERRAELEERCRFFLGADAIAEAEGIDVEAAGVDEEVARAKAQFKDQALGEFNEDAYRAETMEKLRYLAVMEWLQGTVKVNTVPFGGGGGDGGSGSSSGSAAAAAAAGAAA